MLAEGFVNPLHFMNLLKISININLIRVLFSVGIFGNFKQIFVLIIILEQLITIALTLPVDYTSELYAE